MNLTEDREGHLAIALVCGRSLKFSDALFEVAAEVVPDFCTGR